MPQIFDQKKRPLEDLRISLTDRCNFRCSYCMPAGREYQFMPPAHYMQVNEIQRLVSIFYNLGVHKVRLTGGEPLLRKEVSEIVQVIKSEGIEDIALTTNGDRLDKHAQPLKDAGLNRISVSLDAITPEIFYELSGGRGKLDQILKNIRILPKLGYANTKLNAVVKKGTNEQEIIPLIEFAISAGVSIRFIEFMDVGNQNGWDKNEVFTQAQVFDLIHADYKLIEKVKKLPSQTSNNFLIKGTETTVGVIPSVTQPFCGACSRARLSTNGHMYSCLFCAKGLDLLTPLRNGASDEELKELITNRWSVRTNQYSIERESALESGGNRRPIIEMFQIGG